MYIKILLTLLLVLISCARFDQGDFKEGINYDYENGVLKQLYTYHSGKFGYHYYFYKNGIIRAIYDANSKYYLYDKSGNLTSTMYYRLSTDKKHYYKYYTLDSSCILEINDNKFGLFIKGEKQSFQPSIDNRASGNEYSLVINKSQLEIHLFKEYDDVCVGIYQLGNVGR